MPVRFQGLEKEILREVRPLFDRVLRWLLVMLLAAAN
jgi:hypothetical protein